MEPGPLSLQPEEGPKVWPWQVHPSAPAVAVNGAYRAKGTCVRPDTGALSSL